MTKHTTPTCPNCGYDLTGIVRDKCGSARCPECGLYVPPACQENPVTTENVRRMCFWRILLPTTLPGVLFLGFSFLPFPLGSVLILFYMLIGFIAIPTLIITMTLTLLSKSKYSHGSICRREITLYCLF